MRQLCWLILASPVIPAPVWATNTLCDFTGSDDAGGYSFELVGTGEIAMIQVNEPRAMRLGTYEVREFNYRKRRIDLVHTGSGKTGVLPPFTLRGIGDNVLLIIGNRSIKGGLRCQWQLDSR